MVKTAALYITGDCINCDACREECPAGAVYPAAGTGKTINLKAGTLPADHYYIAADKCTGCEDVQGGPQCIGICPMDCIEYID